MTGIGRILKTSRPTVVLNYACLRQIMHAWACHFTQQCHAGVEWYDDGWVLAKLHKNDFFITLQNSKKVLRKNNFGYFLRSSKKIILMKFIFYCFRNFCKNILKRVFNFILFSSLVFTKPSHKLIFSQFDLSCWLVFLRQVRLFDVIEYLQVPTTLHAFVCHCQSFSTLV